MADDYYLKLLNSSSNEEMIELLKQHSRYKALPNKLKQILEQRLLGSKSTKTNNTNGMMILDDSLSITIKSTSKELKRTFEKGLAIVDGTNHNDIEQFWDNILYSVEHLNLFNRAITLFGDTEILGRSEETKAISRAYIVLLHRERRIKTVVVIDDSPINVTIESNWDMIIPIVNTDTSLRATKQYFGHRDISRFTSPIKYYLRSKFLLHDAITETLRKIAEYNLEHQSDGRACHPPTNTELEKITKKIINYILNHHEVYNIPLYSKEEIEQEIQRLSDLNNITVHPKEDILRTLAKKVAKEIGVSFDEAYSAFIALKDRKN